MSFLALFLIVLFIYGLDEGIGDLYDRSPVAVALIALGVMLCGTAIVITYLLTRTPTP